MKKGPLKSQLTHLKGKRKSYVQKKRGDGKTNMAKFLRFPSTKGKKKRGGGGREFFINFPS